MKLWKRFVWAAAAGLLAGILYTIATALIIGISDSGVSFPARWPFRLFFLAVLSCIGAIITELRMPSTRLEQELRDNSERPVFYPQL
jgi:hypothetical protein